MDELSRLGRRLEREIMARLEAERLLEDKSRELFLANASLSRYAVELGQEVGLKARELLVAQRVARIGTLIYDFDTGVWRFSEGLFLLFDLDPAEKNHSIDTILDCVHPDDQNLARSILLPAGSEAGHESREVSEVVRCALPNGKLIWAELRAELTSTDSGDGYQLISTIQDITDKKENELAIIESRMQISDRVAELERMRSQLEEARDQAEHSSRVKSRFLAIMSHEMRTPLNGMYGALQLLEDNRLSGPSAELVTLALKSAEDLRRVTNDVIDLSTMQFDGLEMETHRFLLPELCREVVELWRPNALSKGLLLEFECDEAINPRVVADSGRVRQILINLVSNAVKFSDKGVITIRLGRRSSADRQGACYYIEVSDQGIGMSPSKLKRVLTNSEFEDPVPGQSGTGLGLAISQALVQLMNGQFSAESKLGEGTSIFVDLPLDNYSESDKKTEERNRLAVYTPLKNQNGHSPRILFVDDSLPNQIIGQSMLRRFGCEVDLAANGREAVNAVRSNTYDAVFMDVSMPEMDGIEATAAIRELGPKQGGMPIIGQTAHVQPSELDAFIEIGMTQVLAKPLQMGTLYEVLSSQLERPADSLDTADSAEEGVLERLTSITPIDDEDFETLDEAVLNEMCESIPPEMLDSLFEQVDADLLKHSTAAVAALAAGDNLALAKSAHALKGLAAGFGCVVVERKAKELEQAVKQHQTIEIKRMTGSLERTAVCAVDRLSRYRQSVREAGCA